MACFKTKLKQQRCCLMGHKESADGIVLPGTISPGGKA